MKREMWKCSKGGILETYNRVYDIEVCGYCSECSEGMCDADLHDRTITFEEIDSSPYPMVFGNGMWHTKEEMDYIHSLAIKYAPDGSEIPPAAAPAVTEPKIKCTTLDDFA